MADAETEAEWKRSKQAEAERMKAVQAMNEKKPETAGLAYLDPTKRAKVRGWSSDRALLFAKAEKLVTWSAVLALAGATLGIIADLAGIVSTIGNFGLVSVIIAGIPSGLSGISLVVAVLFGMIGFLVALYFRIKDGKKLGFVGWSGMVSVMLVVIYWWVRSLLIGM